MKMLSALELPSSYPLQRSAAVRLALKRPSSRSVCCASAAASDVAGPAAVVILPGAKLYNTERAVKYLHNIINKFHYYGLPFLTAQAWATRLETTPHWLQTLLPAGAPRAWLAWPASTGHATRRELLTPRTGRAACGRPPP